MLVFFRRFSLSASMVRPCVFTHFKRCCSSSMPIDGKNDEPTDVSVQSNNEGVNLMRGTYNSPLFWQERPQLDSHQIMVVDSDTWSVSSLAHVGKSVKHEQKPRSFATGDMTGNEACKNPQGDIGVDEYDEIEDLRVHGRLFYKIDRGSKEFEEYAFDYHRRKSSSNKNKRETKTVETCSCDSNRKDQKPLNGKDGHQPSAKGRIGGNSSQSFVDAERLVTHNCDSNRKLQKPLNGKDGHQPSTKRHIGDNPSQSFINEERLVRTIKEKYIVCSPNESEVRKKLRAPTFNQLTGPYHEPFCLDIFVSKGSVRACVIHRATSKVVVVAHSISKDMKFELGSPKSVAAAAAVGKVLAQRALADDIHDVIFTPRKGDKLEGKLQIVLQSIMDNGVNVKVKLKQRNPHRAASKPFYNR